MDTSYEGTRGPQESPPSHESAASFTALAASDTTTPLTRHRSFSPPFRPFQRFAGLTIRTSRPFRQRLPHRPRPVGECRQKTVCRQDTLEVRCRPNIDEGQSRGLSNRFVVKVETAGSTAVESAPSAPAASTAPDPSSGLPHSALHHS